MFLSPPWLCSLSTISSQPHIIKSFIYTRCLLETIIFSSQAVHLLLPYSYCHSVIISAFYRSQYVYWFPATTPAEQYYNPRMRSYTLWLFWLQQLPVIKSCTERHKCCLCIQCLEPGNSGYCVAWCSRQLWISSLWNRISLIVSGYLFLYPKLPFLPPIPNN